MIPRRSYDDYLYTHFVTFSCYRRRRLLQHDRVKKIVLGVLRSQLAAQDARCVGYVLMPDHVHALVWFAKPGQLALFMKQWKQRSSYSAKKLLSEEFSSYAAHTSDKDPFWQRKYYAFEIYSRAKLEEKLTYMHLNPVRAGLVERTIDWPWSSARWYECGKTVGLPIQWVE